MPLTQFDRDSMARWYAQEHLKTDPGIVAVYYLPRNSSEREIRFVEVNALIGDRNDNALEPIDFGVDIGDGKRTQAVRSRRHARAVGTDLARTTCALPQDWSLDGVRAYSHE